MKRHLRVIVAGGREFDNYPLLKYSLDKVAKKHEITILSGNARGADRLGELYAYKNKTPIELYPADWAGQGKRAGFIRNELMAEEADGLIAFWDGYSRGTKHMIETATDKELYVGIIRY